MPSGAVAAQLTTLRANEARAWEATKGETGARLISALARYDATKCERAIVELLWMQRKG